MSTFNKLVADLVKENLLDESFGFSTKKTEISNILELPDSIELLKASTPDLLDLAEKHELKLPEFSFLGPENATEQPDEDRVRAILPNPPLQTSFHSTQNFLTYKNRRRRGKSKQKGTKFCRSCALNMPFYMFNCRFCHGKLIGSLSYYMILMFSAVIVTLFLLFILSVKTYK